MFEQQRQIKEQTAMGQFVLRGRNILGQKNQKLAACHWW